MKTSLKTLLTTVTLAGAALLTGCATPNMQATFTRGDEVVYGRVDKIWNGPKLPIANYTFCENRYPELKRKTISPAADKWVSETGFCNDLEKFNQAQVIVGVVNANGDAFPLQAVYKKDMKVSIGDIVAVKVYVDSQGMIARPQELLRIAAKAKDATKASGCYWDAFELGPFRGQGGVVCEGWHWKNHPFSNPKLLKQ